MSLQTDYLCQFLRHTPRILRRQLILQLAEQYLSGESGTEKIDGVCKPSIQRFHGALLFIDISGFTALSQRLNVEDLKNHINRYFSKMLDIVDKHGGDVVKFAGDALFIIWETGIPSENEGEKSTHDERCTLAVKKAVDCGAEINASCCNHKISLARSSNNSRFHGEHESSPRSSTSEGHVNFANLRPKTQVLIPLQSFTSSLSDSAAEEECAYLNVHSGVSVGLMAGIDIGADNRWEYFLIGEPLSKVAEAESQASSGDMIMCPESHALLHKSEHSNSALGSIVHLMSSLRRRLRRDANLPEVLSCGCTRLNNGYCKMKAAPASNSEHRSRRIKKTGTMVGGGQNAIIGAIRCELQDVVKAFDTAFKKAHAKKTLANHLMLPGGQRQDHVDLTVEELHWAFYEWAEACLTDDIARHVHHVMRSEYSFFHISRSGVMERHMHELISKPSWLDEDRLLSFDHTSGSGSASASASAPASAAASASSTPENSFVYDVHIGSSPTAQSRHVRPLSLSLPRMSTSHSHSGDDLEGTDLSDASPTPKAPRIGHIRRKDQSLLRSALLSPLASAETNTTSSMSAELRNVTVMFIKILMTDTELLIDSSKRKRTPGSFRFLGTTVNERVADERLLNKYQKCIEVLSGVLTSYGGQMRQFIVDDKGTVCIGTFGLRGSVSDDNAAAALTAAHMICDRLQELSLQCSIGVTVGRAYCGLVGSSNRHEYAVMGPSTNLSARLMCKAPAYGVICDGETRRRDRTHNFVTLEDVIAKGYSAPVGTFRPEFSGKESTVTEPSSGSAMPHHHQHSPHDNHNIEETESFGMTPVDCNVMARLLESVHGSEKLRGRQDELLRALSFAFTGVVQEFDGSNTYEVFDCRCPARFIGIFGTDGMGKSQLASSVAERVFSVCRGTNIHFFKSHVDSYGADAPFNGWKPILLDMILRIHRSRSSAASHGSNKNGREPSRKLSVNVSMAVDCVLGLLPKELQTLRPLFGYLTILGAQKEADWNREEKIELSIKLILAIFRLYSSTMKSLIFISMENVHAMDKMSLRLLHEVFAKLTGVILLFTLRTNRNSPTSAGLSIIQPFAGAPRFLELQLGCLGKNETFELIKAELAEYQASGTASPTSVAAVEDIHGICESVYELSGGNPLYAIEITRSIASNHADHGRMATPMVQNVRTEDIICYRFDQLKMSAQSLLKMASVICANKGSTFTVTMLARMDEWNLLEGCESFAYPVLSDAEEEFWSVEATCQMERDNSMTKVAYAKILFNVLRCESFVRISKQPATDMAEVDVTVESLLTDNLHFEFVIPLEQATIYNLLLEDQKHALHEGIARYYQKQQSAETTPQKDLVEEAFHWYHSAVWSKALLCYYRAYTMTTENCALRCAYLDKAYSALRSLSEAANALKHQGISFVTLKEVFDDSMNAGGVKRFRPLEETAMTLEKTYEIFGGDSQLLTVGLSTLVQVAVNSMISFENFGKVQLILEDALQMVLLTKNPFLMSSTYLNNFTKARMDLRVDGEEFAAAATEMHFYLKDFWPLCFRLMSSYCLNYVMSTTVASDYSRKAAFMAEEFLSYARKEGAPIDVIQALCVNILIQNKLSMPKMASLLAEELQTLYNFRLHSHKLIEVYEADYTVAVFNQIAKFWFLSDERSKASDFLSRATEWFLKTTHVLSLNLALLNLISVLVYVKRLSDAQRILVHYEMVASRQGEQSLVVYPTVILELYHLWMNRCAAYASGAEDQDDRVSEKSQKMLKELETLLSSKGKAALEGHPLLVFHRKELMIVLADLYAMRVRRDAQNESELTNDCLVCCMHLQRSVVDSPIVDIHDIFANARSVRIVLLVLNVFSTQNMGTKHFRRFRKVWTVSVLSDLLRETQINQLHALNVDVTALRSSLHEAVDVCDA